MNNKLYQYLRIKLAAGADPAEPKKPWYKQLGSDIYAAGADVISGVGENVRRLGKTTDINEAAIRKMNDDNYNQAIAALKAGEDPGYDAWNGGHMSTMGAESYDLEQGYEDALNQQQQQQQQNNQPTINVNLPESYGGGGQPAQAASGGYAPQQGPSLADRISAYSSRAGY